MEHPTESELAEFLYDELSHDRQIEVAKHIDTCADCRATITSWRDARDAMKRWQIPQRSVTPAKSASWSVARWSVARWAAAAMVTLAFGYGVGRVSAMRNEDTPQLRAQIADQVRGELRNQLGDELHAEFAKLVFDQSDQQQVYERALVQAARQLDARRAADYASLRRDVETVALQTQEKFDSMSVPRRPKQGE